MNRIHNATGLDGVTGWSSPEDETTDFTVRGAPGRGVIVGSDREIYTFQRPLEGATSVFARTLFFGTAARLYFDVGGAPYLPTVRVASREATRGIASTFNQAEGFFPVPVGAAFFQIGIEAPDGQPAGIFRPQVSFQAPGTPRPCWRPGPHFNPDLDLPSFPDLAFQREGFELEPIALRKTFAGDAGVPTSRRVAATSRRFATAEFALDAVDRDLLDQFWRENHDEFWFVRPDNGDLCIAEWADDGDPKDTGAGAGRRTSIRLLLRDS